MTRLLFVLTFALLIQSTVSAQRFGDGRFIRRIFGQEAVPSQSAAALEAAKQAAEKKAAGELAAQKTAKSRSLEPQPAPRYQPPRPPQDYRRSLDPVPNYRPSNSREPAPTKRPAPYPSRNDRYSRDRQPTPAKRQQVDDSRRNSSSLSNLPGQPRPLERPPKPKGILDHKGFGVTVRLVKESVVIARVHPNGTGNEAGLREGDVIKTIGSLPIKVPTDVEQFDGVLKPGDQVEIEFARRGEEDSVLIPYLRKVDASDLKRITEAQADQKRDTEKALASLPDSADSFDDLGKSPPQSDSEVEQLVRVVRMQQQLIEKLQSRLDKLETSSDTDELLLNAP